MKTLELKIPPLLLVLAVGFLMWLLSSITPNTHINCTVRYISFLSLVCLGLFCVIAGVISFRKAKTTVNPMQPDTASELVTTGIYRITRNPMYLGFLFCLIGWGIFLVDFFSLVFIIGFVIYMNYLQIIPEEKILTKLFGDKFIQYKQHVRRWI